MKILVIAPLPPPITGHSLASQVFVDGLRGIHQAAVVDLGLGTASDGTISIRRIVEVFKVLKQVWRESRTADAIYLTISESVAGNAKDLLIYALCVRRLSRMFIHLHGGSIKKLLFDRYRLLRNVNTAFIRNMGGVIISGRSHTPIFADMIDGSKIYIVPNFAQDNLFLSERATNEKFGNVAPLRVLYISGMREEKGYNDLTDAYLSLSDGMKQCIRVDFAGKFDSDLERTRFEERIAGVEGIRYHGMVDEKQKERLFAQAHAFCLPTSMFEGQPISILEAYASGCVVLTTGQDGIHDVFAHGVNGFEIEERSPAAIARVLDTIARDAKSLQPIAMENRTLAMREFRTARFNGRLTAIIASAVTRLIAE